jgi:hypothetical protein
LALHDFALPKEIKKKSQRKKKKKISKKKEEEKKKKKTNKKNVFFGSYYPKIDVRSIVAYLVWAPYGSVWLLQSVTHIPQEKLPNIELTTAPIGPSNC